MKHVSYFDTFLRDVVNLNQSRIDTLEQRVETLEEFVSLSDYEPDIVRFNPQGSWAHKTIIKPPGGKDFDADLLAVVEAVPDWDPEDYVTKLFESFRGSGRYSDIVRKKTRCVRVDYANDFHVDLIPIIEERGGNGVRYFNCNSRDNGFEATAPEDYTNWWKEKNGIVGSNQLRKVTRLLKYLRDIKTTFSCKSILLTTLVGYQVLDDDGLRRVTAFCDLPTSLRTIVGRLDDALQIHAVMPRVPNPVLEGEDYNRHWNQKKYDNFREKIHKYREWIDEAYEEEDHDESILKWRRVFGDDFAKSVVVKSSARQLAPMFRLADEWISKIRQFGSQVLASFPVAFDHVVRPRWKVEQRLQVSVRAWIANSENGDLIREVCSGDPFSPGLWIKFLASSPTGLPDTFHVEWRVVNTGGEAAQHSQLRGGFRSGVRDATLWESTRFRGVHWVEAFVINKRNGVCVGQSERFFVVID